MISKSFSNYYNDIDREIEINQINVFKEEKLFVIVDSGLGIDKKIIVKENIELPVEENVYKAITEGKSIVYISENSNLKENRKKLLMAKENNYTTVEVLVSSNIDRIIENGGKGLLVEDIHQSFIKAKEVYDGLKDDHRLVDFVSVVKI